MTLIRFLSFQLVFALFLIRAAFTATELDPGQISISVGRLLEQGHYNRTKLDDKMSRQLLMSYIEALDYNRLFFTQNDIKELETKYAVALDDDILLGNPEPAFEIFNLYTKRVEERVAKIKELLSHPFDFKSDRFVEINRQKSPWANNEAEADQLWHDRIEGELLQEKLNEHAIDPPVKVVTRRYNQVLRNIQEQTREDIIKTFLSVLSQTYDPHSEYLSKSELESFSINMRLSLVGIGAVLQSEEGYAKIKDLVPGGPAQVDGRLKVNDRIVAVAQDEKEFVDVIDMKLDKVVELIRGKKGTKVRLQVIPSQVTDPSERKIIEIVRDNVKLKEQEAKAEIIEKEQTNGSQKRVGWITLPSFYADMEHANSKTSKSTTRDVLSLLNRLKQENIEGLVVDLRRNGGGSLEEAVNLTGLFIKKGPVVQSKDSNGNIFVARDRDSSISYDGPLVVLTNRLSASASEILAAALQDYGRAVIVGDGNSFGKGTVQTVLEIGRFIPFLGGNSDEAGALKLTIQKFYRIAGGSTQLHGVTSDIKLSSLYDQPDIGESALKNPMPYDEVDPVPYEKVLNNPLPLKELKKRTAARVTLDQEFRYVFEDLELIKRKLAANKISLNEKVRRTELAEDKIRKEKRLAERAKRKIPDQKVFQITLDNVDIPELQLAKHEKPLKTGSNDSENADEEENEKNPAIDEVRNETLNILNDLIELSRSPKTASVK